MKITMRCESCPRTTAVEHPQTWVYLPLSLCKLCRLPLTYDVVDAKSRAAGERNEETA